MSWGFGSVQRHVQHCFGDRSLAPASAPDIYSFAGGTLRRVTRHGRVRDEHVDVSGIKDSFTQTVRLRRADKAAVTHPLRTPRGWLSGRRSGRRSLHCSMANLSRTSMSTARLTDSSMILAADTGALRGTSTV
ncbi:hypothetical protein BD310DRAFT_128567 [Dichomitus squalens]|uniref:Uncharacterized protein n=1 Tax=Dichomitus squalens TaxID=114155 RepID=A0A4Q9PFY0_9APHY|nr:hypothetical protein BD310DRAFT_128567 [Dichomitus squalens]